MKKFVIILTLILPTLVACSSGRAADPYSYGGILDLRGYDFRHNHNIVLQGEWEIYKGRLLNPADLNGIPGDETSYADPSLQWHNIYINGEQLPGEGCATFRLKILLDETNRVYGIRLPKIESAYILYINGVECGRVGEVAMNREGYRPHIMKQTYYFNAAGGQADIVLQMAHFGSRYGGSSGVFQLGPAPSIQISEQSENWLNYLLIGALIIISVYNIALFLPLNKYPAPFFFGLFCIVMLFFNLIEQSELIPRLFPTLNSFWLHRAGFILLLMVMPLYNSVIHTLYKQTVSIAVIIVMDVLSLLLLIPTMFLPMNILRVVEVIYVLLISINSIYLIAAMIKSYRAGIRRELYLVIGSSVFFVTALNDFLYTNRIIDSVNLTAVGLLVLIISQALMLTKIFSDTYLLSDNLSKELKKKNDQLNEFAEQLEQKVLDRTEELKKAQNQIIVQEKLASLGKLTAGIAHEIKNPLNFVNNFAQLSGELVEEIEADVSKCKTKVDPDTYEDISANLDSLKFNVSKINEHGERADNIVKSMLQHAREKSDKKTPVNINKLVDEFVGLAYHGQRAKDSSFTVDIEKQFDESVGEIEVFAQDLGRVILNIAGNAFYAMQERLKNSKKDYKPKFTATTKKLPKQVEIRLRDNGTGIPPEALEKLFTPFFTTKPAGKGTGLGLSLSYDIVVQEHKGDLKVETEKGKFTEFIIRLPA